MMFAYIYIVILSEIPATVLGVTLEQGQPTLVKAVGKTSYLPCKVTDLQSWNYIHWYQKREGEAPSRLLYINAGGSFIYDTNNPQANDFTVDRTQLFNLKLSNTKPIHAAVYYCAYWDTGNGLIKRFGTGTRLIVTDQGKDTTKSPTLTAYLPTTKESGKQTRICQATDMFPDLVKFNWKKKSNTGDWTDVSEDNVVEQRNVDPVIVTSILIVDQYTAGEDLYQCTLTYEGGMKQKTLQNDKDPANNNEGATVKPTCSPDNKTSTIQISGSSDQIPSLYLFVYAYGVMLMKNGVYFCAVLIVLLKRKVGNKKESA
ncbi:immunoglobulin kappa light chain-like isoform X5 [Pimephales promelas]|uniref:immunoglobulin kappa light chain-like isoform X5 n=1 Tax=Pimephales promelas TaxID=90988 RepID=UPI0019556759|nr:immunoglobulin kappa light chain-like isoform X5 [Pimephales promelas]